MHLDFASPQFLSDPYPTYDYLLQESAVHWMPMQSGGMWLISRYDLVMAALKDTFISKDFSHVAPAEYLTPINLSMRRHRPQKDMISELIRARDGAHSLSEEELTGTCILLLIAGHETTVNLLGNGLRTLRVSLQA